MDVEVQRAYRVLQRAGITIVPMSPEMPLEELTKNYGRLIYEWLQRQGMAIKLIRTHVAGYQTDIQKHFQGLVTIQRGVIPHVVIDLPVDAAEEDIHAAFWCHTTPHAIQALLQSLTLQRSPYDGPQDGWEKKIIVALFEGRAGAGTSAQGFIYSCRPPSEKEKAVEEARRTKAAAKAARDAENRRKRQEARDKEQLKKLVAKYGKDAI